MRERSPWRDYLAIAIVASILVLPMLAGHFYSGMVQRTAPIVHPPQAAIMFPCEPWMKCRGFVSGWEIDRLLGVLDI